MKVLHIPLNILFQVLPLNIQVYCRANLLVQLARSIVLILEKPNFIFFPLAHDWIIIEQHDDCFRIEYSELLKNLDFTLDLPSNVRFVQEMKPTLFDRWFSLSLENVNVKNCLILFEKAIAELKWINYYKIVEIINSCPLKKISSEEKIMIKKLKRTSQSYELVGIMSSRHGYSKDRSIEQFAPLKDVEAEELVRSLIISWITNILDIKSAKD